MNENYECLLYLIFHSHQSVDIYYRSQSNSLTQKGDLLVLNAPPAVPGSSE